MNKKILIIGSGGREHALAWKLKSSPKVGEIFIAPGNAGTAELGENVDIKVTDISALANFAQTEQIYLTVVGSDDPLALGIVDEFQKRNLKIWGPKKAAMQIESSKVFSKELMAGQNIPTAGHMTFTDYQKALGYLKNTRPPYVIKADGLAAGKGVSICQTPEEAQDELKKIMVDKIFGASGNRVVIEEFLTGREISAHAFSDGKTFKLLPPAQDHKTIFEGDKGPNTGGMGSIAPVPWVTKDQMTGVAEKIVAPLLKGMEKLGTPFVGLLFPGLMMTQDGPKVIEFNGRFGDPETQSFMRLLKTDLLDILDASVDGQLKEINIEWENKFACCIILASTGYPGKFEKGKPITGLEEASKLDDITIFHAGTIIQESIIVTNGGRVLGVTAVADDLKTALDKAYTAVKLINFEGMHYRTDIGAKSLGYTLPTTH
jgi:phosphoribosylamine--glycine ligase